MSAIFLLVPMVIFVVVALAQWTRSGPRGSLSSRERRELADACIRIGIPPEEVQQFTSRADDRGLIERHRLEHRRLKNRTGPFR
ncbi:MAG: hypothetical protein U0174_21910 [Polyangiaceae bacterium]